MCVLLGGGLDELSLSYTYVFINQLIDRHHYLLAFTMRRILIFREVGYAHHAKHVAGNCACYPGANSRLRKGGGNAHALTHTNQPEKPFAVWVV